MNMPQRRGKKTCHIVLGYIYQLIGRAQHICCIKFPNNQIALMELDYLFYIIKHKMMLFAIVLHIVSLSTNF